MTSERNKSTWTCFFVHDLGHGVSAYTFINVYDINENETRLKWLEDLVVII